MEFKYGLWLAMLLLLVACSVPPKNIRASSDPGSSSQPAEDSTSATLEMTARFSPMPSRPAASPTPDVVQPATPTPTPTPVTFTSSQLTPADLSTWNINWYTPHRFELSVVPLIQGMVLPKTRGKEQYFGSLRFGSGEIFPFLLDRTSSNGAALYLDTDQDNDLAEEAAIPLTGWSKALQVNLNYGGETKPYRFVLYVLEQGGQLQLYGYSDFVMAGMIALAGKDYPIALRDTDLDGLYDNMDADVLLVDIDRGRSFRQVSAGGGALSGVFDSMRRPIMAGDQCYRVSGVNANGDNIQLQPVGLARLSGTVKAGGGLLAGAQAVLDGHTVKTDHDGRFLLEICPGRYERLTLSHFDYLPYRLNDLVIEPEQVLALEIALTEFPEERSGEVTLANDESFSFVTRERDWQKGTEIYISIKDRHLMLFANGYLQRGIKDLGNLATKDLMTVKAPKDGYNDRTGIPGIYGHTYAVQAQEGLESHYVLFRVKEIGVDYVVMTYLVE